MRLEEVSAIKGSGCPRPAWTLLAGVVLWCGLAGPAAAQGPPTDLEVSALSAAQPVTPIPRPPHVDPAVLALGARLFGDPHLSGHGRVSCQSCHDLATNGADHRVLDRGDDGLADPLNTPTVYNAALSFRLNWRGNAPDLVAQAAMAFKDPHLMGGSLDHAAASVAADPTLARLFRKAYGRRPDAAGILDALARFETTLLTPDSPFDRYLAGDKAALDPQARAGYELFQELGCSSCHQGVNLGGNLWQPHGVFSPATATRMGILRVPSLRNVAATAPYFHDGSAATLGDAVSDMARSQLGRSLSDEQTASILAFLDSLTGRIDGRLVSPAR